MAHLITDHYLMMVCTAPPRPKEKTMDDALHILLKGALTQKNVPGVIFFSDPIFFAQSFPVTIFYFADFTDTDLPMTIHINRCPRKTSRGEAVGFLRARKFQFPRIWCQNSCNMILFCEREI